MGKVKVKVNGKVHPRTGHKGPEWEQRYISTLPLTSELDGCGWSTPRPGRFTSGKETRQPLYRRLGGPQGRYDDGGKIKIVKLTTYTLKCPDDPNRKGAMQGIYSMYVEIGNVQTIQIERVLCKGYIACMWRSEMSRRSKQGGCYARDIQHVCGDQKCLQVFGWKTLKDHLEDIRVHDRTVLKWSLSLQSCSVGTE